MRPLLLKIPEACALAGIGETCLREYIREGKIELVKIGSASRIPLASIERFVAELPRKRGSEIALAAASC